MSYASAAGGSAQGGCTADAPCAAIADALAAAGPGGLVLLKGCAGKFAGGAAQVSHSVTLLADDNCAVDIDMGGQSGRAFFFRDAPCIHMRGVHIRNGVAEGVGGGMRILNAERVILSHGAFEDNRAFATAQGEAASSWAAGGGLAVANVTVLHLSAMHFSGNRGRRSYAPTSTCAKPLARELILGVAVWRVVSVQQLHSTAQRGAADWPSGFVTPTLSSTSRTTPRSS